MQSWFKPAVLAIGLAFGSLASMNVVAADPVEEVFALVSKGQYQRALTSVDKILEGNPKELNARFMRGVILSELNRPDEAIEAFKNLIAEQPDLPEPYNNLAALYAQQRRYLDARDSLEKAVRINPGYTTALENLGDLYLRLAGDVYAKARNLEDASPETARKLASVKNLIGGTRDAQVATADGNAKKPATAAAVAPAASLAKENAAAAASLVPPVAVAKTEEPVAPAKGKKAAKAEPAKVVAKPAKTEPTPKAEEPAKLAESPKSAAENTEAPANSEAATFDTAAVEDAVRNWAESWASKDADGYLAAYAADFRPSTPGGRVKWENQRRERITKPESINIELEGLSIKQIKDKAIVTFVQHYRSPIHKSDDNKTLVMAQRDGVWQIVEERIGK